MSYRITEKAAMRVVGIRIPLVADMEENQKVVPEFWKDTLENNQLSKIIELVNQEPKGILGVTAYVNSQEIFYYIAASTTEAVPKNMFEFEIPASTWVVFENDGYFKEDVQNIFKRFYTEWLPFSGYEYAGLPDLEVYPVMQGKPLNGHSEVWIGIKKEKEN